MARAAVHRPAAAQMTGRDPTAPDRLSPAMQTAILAFGAAVALGFGRFAYALILPDMRADLGWSYSQAGWMNGVNAAGYLAGALAAARIGDRLGRRASFAAGVMLTALAILATGMTRDFHLLSLLRLLAGISGALIFVLGGSMAAEVSRGTPRRSAFILSLFYTGPGIGIALSGAILPWYTASSGPQGWPGAWLLLGICALAAGTVSVFGMPRSGAAAADDPAGPGSFRIRASLPILMGYAAFGAGYIGYMTFMIALLKQMHASVLDLSVFWIGLGLAGIASPWIWSGLIGTQPHGRALSALIGVTAIGAVIPLLTESIVAAWVSGMVFGSAVIAVVAATTAFVRRNAQQSDWTRGIGLFTIFFGAGQTFGPVLVGFLSDRADSLAVGLWYGCLFLLAGTVLALFQKDLPAPAR